MIYADNAATSSPKPESVIKAVEMCLRNHTGNPGRGSHEIAINTTRSVFEAREVIANFFGIKDVARLVFTKNATEALNIAIFGILKKGDHVITTSMEHNSVLRPLYHLHNAGIIELSIVYADKFGKVTAAQIENEIKKNTCLICLTYASNVNGTIMPVDAVSKLALKKGILFLLDASTAAGSRNIDISKTNIDLMAFPGHKALMGPQGTGGLYVKNGIKILPLMMGGTGSLSESLFQPDFFPDALESGTLNVPGIMGLKAGVEFITQIGIETIKKHKISLTKQFIDGLRKLDKITCHSLYEENENVGITAIELNDVDSNEVSFALDKVYNIRTRAGYHCAPLAHKSLGKEGVGLVRFSFGYFNNENEVQICLNSLREF